MGSIRVLTDSPEHVAALRVMQDGIDSLRGELDAAEAALQRAMDKRDAVGERYDTLKAQHRAMAEALGLVKPSVKPTPQYDPGGV